jgi:hypothetical protein
MEGTFSPSSSIINHINLFILWFALCLLWLVVGYMSYIIFAANLWVSLNHRQPAFEYGIDLQSEGVKVARGII